MGGKKKRNRDYVMGKTMTMRQRCHKMKLTKRASGNVGPTYKQTTNINNQKPKEKKKKSKTETGVR